MLKLLTRRFFAALVLLSLFLFGASSALGARHSRHETKRATHRHVRHHRRAGRRGRVKRVAVHNATSRTATVTSTTVLLGDEGVESLKDHLAGGQAEAFPFPARTSGATGAVHVYIDSNDSATTLIVGLYANLNGHPGSLLTSGSLSAPQSRAWDTATVAPTQLVSGTTYWLAVLGTGGTLRYRDRWHGPCKAETSRQTNLGVLASLWSTGALYSTCPISAYVTPATSTLPEGPPVEVQPVESPPPPPPPPPPPAAPANSSPPAISGTATEGQLLTATTGAWTGSPTSYAYQWQDCDAAGANCTNVSGAQATGYTLQTSDVGHTLRVVVTATNSGGSTPASSAASAAVIADPPPPSPPTASFSYSPSLPVAGQPVTLDGTSSTCPDGPCAYAWSDDGGTTQPIPALWPLGSGQTLLFTFGGAGTKYVRLVVTDATGQTATVEHNVVVTEATPPPPPPPPAAPVDTTLPAISGSTVEGDTLSATAGTWGGEPTSYTYQWQDCNSSGESCAVISGATSATYNLASSDVGHRLRAVVTATNAGGSTSATSTATAAVTAIPPAAPVNAALPVVSGSAVEGQTLTTTNGTWTGSPTSYAYQWQDCSTSGSSCTKINSATRTSYKLASSDVGHTLRAVATASNTGGSTQARSVATASVVASEPTPPAAPTNTALPTISGTAAEGSVLSAGKGSWTGSPSSYAYQWQDCNSSGASCVNVTGATSSSHTLGSGDVSHAMRVLVTATNAGGSTQVSSAQSATVIAHTSAQTGCFSAPGACGYPDPKYSNVGPSVACSSLTPSGSLTVSTAGATIQNMNITGEVTVSAPNVILTNDCIRGNGYHIIFLSRGATGFQITSSDVFGSPAVQEAINNNNGNTGAIADHDYIYNCGECVHGAWTLTNSYVTSNATISGEHYEDIYCSDETFIAEHDVLSNPHEQTANLFCNANGGSGGAADNHVTLTNSLLAGSGYSLYPQGNSNSVGTSTMEIVGNRFARCLTARVVDKEGDVTCSGGADQYGYWPNGGYYGIDAYIYCPPTPGQEWSNNVWDDNNESIGC